MDVRTTRRSKVLPWTLGSCNSISQTPNHVDYYSASSFICRSNTSTGHENRKRNDAFYVHSSLLGLLDRFDHGGREGELRVVVAGRVSLVLRDVHDLHHPLL